ncbi:phage tail protein [uncultured Marinobacter sp.]|uniref:phage tail protein n=1 Tax=uncultured Marinobacter sp. TaxID=187379 RepID=UPI0025E637B6|nr:phage tail protein [uncultured Marinobacter sp.]
MADYYVIPTNIGEAKMANALALGIPLAITEMAVGDGEGAGAQGTPIPNPNATALVSERRRAPLNSFSVDPENSNVLIAEQVIPESEGGWWIREMGLFDEDGDLIFLCNTPPTYKPQVAEGSGRTQVVRMASIVSDTAAVTLKVDPSVVLATREYVSQLLVAHNNEFHRIKDLPGNDFNLATESGRYLAFGDDAGVLSSANAPAGSGNVRLILYVDAGDQVITQTAVSGRADGSFMYHRSSQVSNGDYEAALTGAEWVGAPRLNKPNVFQDSVGEARSLIDIEHNADGSGSGNNQTYGLDVHNNPGARSGIVGHQYSNVGPFMWLDNTDNQPMVRINNTSNPTRNPNGPATAQGDFLELMTNLATRMRLRHDYVWEMANAVFTVVGTNSKGMSVQTPAPNANSTLEVIRQHAANAGIALDVKNSGGTGIKLTQTGPGIPMQISAATLDSDGFYAGQVFGWDFGLNITTEEDGGNTVFIDKKGLSSSPVVVIRNRGTGYGLTVEDAGGNDLFSIDSSGKPAWRTASNVQATVGSAGAAAALPASPSKYLKVVAEDGQVYVIPAFLP